VSLTDQRKMQMRSANECALRRAVMSARREAVVLQRAQLKEKRYDRFLGLKEQCLGVKFPNRRKYNKAARRVASPSPVSRRAVQPTFLPSPRGKAAAPEPTTEHISAANKENVRLQKAAATGRSRSPSAARSPSPPKDEKSTRGQGDGQKGKPPMKFGLALQRGLVDKTASASVMSSSRLSSPPVQTRPTSRASTRKNSNADVGKLMGVLDGPSSSTAGGSTKAVRQAQQLSSVGSNSRRGSFVDRFALELRSVRTPSKRGSLDDAATEKLLQELSRKVRETADKMERRNSALLGESRSRKTSFASSERTQELFGLASARSFRPDPGNGDPGGNAGEPLTAEEEAERRKQLVEDKSVMEGLLAFPVNGVTSLGT